MKLHLETREESVYFLVEGKTGKAAPEGLQVTAEGSCNRVEDAAAPPDPRACGSFGMGQNHLEGHEISMGRFAEALSRVLDRKVIDRTGRAEKFNFAFQWVPDEHAPASDDLAALPPDTPAIFTALREQLGLKLETGRALVQVMVIESAERPIEN